MRPYELQLVRNPYGVPDGSSRIGLMIKGRWDNSIADLIKEKGVTALYLNVSRGWTQTDYRFLEKLTQLEELNIIAGQVTGLSAVESLSNMETLSLTCATKDIIDFSRVQALKQCYLYCWKGADSLLQCRSLTRLHLDEAKKIDYTPLAELKKLTELEISNSDIQDLSSIATLSNLKKLSLVSCKLIEHFDSLVAVSELERLTISYSKALENIEFISALQNLVVIDISDDGPVESLSPVKNLDQLRAFAFAGSTVITDGDLSPLVGLPKLAMLMFAPRKHYSHKLIKPWNWRNFDKPDMLLAPRQ